MTTNVQKMTDDKGMIISPWRRDFPVLSKQMNGMPLCYLDSSASAQKPNSVICSMTDLMQNGYANVHRGLYQYSSELTRRYEDVRNGVARFIGASSPNEIIFTHGATESINLVARSLGTLCLNPGDEIILSVMEHHANIVPWQMMAKERGATIRVVPMTTAYELDRDALGQILSSRTKIVAVTHISNVLGTINPIKEITHQIKSYNPEIYVLIDGAQGAVHTPVDVADIGCDFYALTGHKLYGPTGVGVLYGRADVLDTMPPYQGGGDMIETVDFSDTTYRAPPHRFEAGTPPILEVIGFGAAIDYIDQIGWPNITAHEHELTMQLEQALSRIPEITIYGPKGENRAGIFSFTASWGHASDIAMILDQSGVAVRTGHHCGMPLMRTLGVPTTLRASLALYNNGSDVTTLTTALEKARRMLT